MIKILLFSFTCFSFSFSVAQLTVDVKSGINISNINKYGNDPRARVAWYCGASIRTNICGRFFFQPELLYSSKGNVYTPLAGHTSAARLNYITAPILLGFQATNKLSILLGPEFGYLIKAALRYDNTVATRTEIFSRFDPGIDFGLKFIISKKLSVEARYNYGFKALHLVVETYPESNEHWANKAFQTGLSYRLKK